MKFHYKLIIILLINVIAFCHVRFQVVHEAEKISLQR